MFAGLSEWTFQIKMVPNTNRGYQQSIVENYDIGIADGVRIYQETNTWNIGARVMQDDNSILNVMAVGAASSANGPWPVVSVIYKQGTLEIKRYNTLISGTGSLNVARSTASGLENLSFLGNYRESNRGFQGSMQFMRLYGKALDATELQDTIDNDDFQGTKYNFISGWDLRFITGPQSSPVVVPNLADGQPPLTLSGSWTIGTIE